MKRSRIEIALKKGRKLIAEELKSAKEKADTYMAALEAGGWNSPGEPPEKAKCPAGTAFLGLFKDGNIKPVDFDGNVWFEIYFGCHTYILKNELVGWRMKDG